MKQENALLPHVIVIGSGPAGLSAAIAAAEHGVRCTVLERMTRLSAKLLASGGGHCNITNHLPLEEFASSFGREGRFLLPALHRFYRPELFALFAGEGVHFQAEDSFHYFPETNRASDVAEALVRRCQRLGIELRTGCKAVHLQTEEGRITGVVPEDSSVLPADAVVLAGGGCAFPGLGGSSAGLDLARQTGHTVTPLFPALAPLRIREAWTHTLPGITLPDAELFFHLNRRTIRKNSGILLFTHTGVSGPCALDLTGDLAEALSRSEDGTLPLTLVTEKGCTQKEWEDRLSVWRKTDGAKHIFTLLSNRIPKKLAGIFCRLAGCEETPLCQMKGESVRRLTELLSACTLTAEGTDSFDHAMAMKGGIRLREVDPDTLESRLVKQLYFAGEILDLSGPCGGYHIQWAFSSGHLAGVSAAQGCFSPGRLARRVGSASSGFSGQ